MEITKHSPSMALSPAAFEAALKTDPVLKHPNINQLLARIITDAYVTKGVTPTANDITLQVNKLHQEITTVFPTLKVGELELAFFNGLRGSFGEYIGLNVVTYHQWIKSVLNDERRGKIIISQKQPLQISNEPTPEEQERMYRDRVGEGFKEFKEKGKIRDYGNLIYHYLEKNGLLHIPADKKWQFMELAKDQMITDKRRQALDPEEKFGKKIDCQNFLERIEQNRLTKNDQTALIIEAKNISLNWHFSNLVAQNKTPFEL